MTEANQNFSKAAHIVDQQGSAAIMKNNDPSSVHIKTDPRKAHTLPAYDSKRFLALSDTILKQNQEAYTELAK